MLPRALRSRVRTRTGAWAARWRRVMAPLVAVAMLLGLGASAVVQGDALRAHVVCPEDGAAVHAEGNAAHAPEGAALSEAKPHGHEQACELGSLGAPPPSAFAHAQAHLSDAPALPPEAPVAPRPGPRSRDHLRFAPKTSPPVVC